MGCCYSYEEIKVHRIVNQECAKKDIRRTYYFCLMGAHNAGTTEYFEQMRIQFGEIPSTRFREILKQYEIKYTIKEMKRLINYLEMNKMELTKLEFNQEEEEKKEEKKEEKEETKQKIEMKQKKFLNSIKDLQLSEEGEKALEYMDDDANDEVNDQMINAIKVLWKEKLIQLIFERYHPLNMLDRNASYWFENFETIVQPDYILKDMDLMKTLEQSKINSEKYVMDCINISITNFNRNLENHAKLQLILSNMGTLIYVASLLSYCEYMDDNSNVLDNDIISFHYILNASKQYGNKLIILLFNRFNEFEQCLNKTRLSDCFSDYHNSNSPGECLEYLKNKYLLVNTDDSYHIYTHVTNTTDNEDIKQVFWYIRSKIAPPSYGYHG